ncbi:MAG: Thiamine biosynthesis protein [Cenarchaeum symbiont of Oopsacas minuta]|nr:Thiamine biosynthesis protein [Cenarchaeum symbiont of Oopsacas minuta]
MDSFVVVFPSTFARNMVGLLVSNIKKILDIKKLPYDKIWRDGQIIVIDARDPVFASSAIGLLYGIERIAIARRVGSGFEEVVKEMAKVCSSLILRGDRFFIKVGGTPYGTTAGDLELAATSTVIKTASASGALPGTIGDHSRFLYTHLTKNNAYVCIFLDNGLGGLPQGVHKGQVLCCIYDELSAIACLETFKHGFDTKIIVCHKGGANLRKLVKMLDRILSRVVSSECILEFYRLKNVTLSEMPYVSLTVARAVAKKSHTARICIPSSPVVYPARQMDIWIQDAVKDGLVPYTPLGGLEKELYVNAKEAGLGEFSPPLLRQKMHSNEKAITRKAKDALAKSEKIVLKIGVNCMHEMLDSLECK